jgi:GT2 family glycosyltransferase
MNAGRASEPILSVVVCTHERPGHPRRVHLRRCLEALSALDDVVEVIVVDSASQPPVEEAVASFEDRLSDLHYVYVAEPGLSLARNVGAQAASRELVAFVDDDAAPTPDWARRVVARFARAEIACVGGTCRAAFERTPPRWLTTNLLALAGITSFGREARAVAATADYPFGANIAFRRSALLEVGGFDEELGRVGESLLSGEETAVVRRLLAAGHEVWIDPHAVVDHTVTAERMQGRYYWRRFFWQGVTRARMGGRVRRLGGLALEVPLYVRQWLRTRDRYYLYRASAETIGHFAEWVGRGA